MLYWYKQRKTLRKWKQNYTICQFSARLLKGHLENAINKKTLLKKAEIGSLILKQDMGSRI